MARVRLRLLVVAESTVAPVDVVCPILMRWPGAEVHVVVRGPSAWTAVLAAAEEAWIGVAPVDPYLAASVERADEETVAAYAAEVRHLLAVWGMVATVEVGGRGDELSTVRAAVSGRRPAPDLVAIGEPRERLRRWRRSATLRRLSRQTGVTVVDLGWRAPIGTHVPSASEGAPA